MPEGGQKGRVSPARGGNVPRKVTTATAWQKHEGGAYETSVVPRGPV